MSPILFHLLRTYAPYVVLPVAAVVGAVGYTIENMLSDKYTPAPDSIEVKRRQRQMETGVLKSAIPVEDTSSFIPKTIFEKNLSPSLRQDKN